MTKMIPLSLRPAGAAIAAVLALSIPTANAQDGASMADPLAPPVIVPVSPAPPVSAPATPTAPPALPEVLRAPPVVPPTGVETATPPSVPDDGPSLDRPLPPVEPVPQTDRVERPRTVSRASSERSAAGRVAEPRRANESAGPAAAVVTPMPTTVLPSGTVVPEPVGADPVISASPPAGRNDSLGEWALFGGLVGIGGIAAAAALSRRRRPNPEPEPFSASVPHEIVPSMGNGRAREPVSVMIPSQAAVSASVSTLARPATAGRARPATVGRHEAMVDAGPTADNPFLTRRNRLRRARFLDRQEAAADIARSEPDRRYATR